MTEHGFGRRYATSLRYKILFGFLFSIIPMLAIVAITYFPSRESALESSHNQIALISSNGAEHFDVFFKTAATTFANWTEEDIFGMAVEFSALDELKKHFVTLQADNPDFQLLVITDKTGTILEQNRSRQTSQDTSVGLTENITRDIRRIKEFPETPLFIVSHPSAGSKGESPLQLLYRFPTVDSSGKQNGYFLAYLQTMELDEIAKAIHLELARSGFAASRVEIIDAATEKTVLFAGQQLSEESQYSTTPIRTILQKSLAGEIRPYDAGDRTEHIVYFPLTTFPSILQDSTAISQHRLNLYLMISVEEKEIMAMVHKTLMLSSIIAALGLLVTVGLGFVTVKTITDPIRNLVTVLQRYAGGDASVRAEVKSHDEIGFFTKEFNSMLEQLNSSGAALQESEARYRHLFDELQAAVNNKNYEFRFTPLSREDDLATSLNKMLETLEKASVRTEEEDWLKTGLTNLSERISGEHELADLCNNAITFIADYTGIQVGTIFVKHQDDDETNSYVLIASYAFRNRKGLSNQFRDGEGLIGQAALEKKIIQFNDVPDDYIRIESSLGQAQPTNIIVIPLIYEDEIQGVMELGASFPFSRRHITFSEQVSSVVAVAINSAIANDRLKELLEQTRKQSETLKTQQEELQKANAELEEQTETLRESEARLQLQQEELQTSNEEMEEKNQLLEEQKRENEEKNRHLQEKQREIEEKARQLELATKYKSEFLSNMSHELRTPLNSILLLAKMLSDNDENNLTEDQIESAASIHRGGQTLLHLINDILDLSKIEAGRVELNISAVRPETIRTDFEMEFNHIAKNKGLEFLIELDDALPDTIITDVYRLEQIIRNLLGNAFKFTEKGSVTLSLERPDAQEPINKEGLTPANSIKISVTDTGPGIPDDKFNQIFEAFRQVDGSISRRHGGTGLGLSISRELTRLLGGELKVESEVDKGATFIVYIPQTLKTAGAMVELPDKPEQPPPAVETKRKTTRICPPPSPPEVPEPDLDKTEPSTKRMLIIEDDAQFSSILIDFFKKSGYESIIAPTGEKGVKYAIEYKPTAIILDIGLPGIDGWTVLGELKNNPDTRHIPVHIMSAYDQSYEGLKKGAVGYLTKPVSMDGLRSALSKFEHVLENSVKELLVVEDDRELRNNILKLMGTNDIHATTAETGKEAVEYLRTNRFDCMILDLGLPDISGFTLLDEIEHDSSINKLPIIIYTGRDLTIEETEKLEKYSSSIVLKNALSMERLLDETALFMHRVEQKMPESHRRMIEELREKESNIKGKRVLLVDDDMRNAFALSKFLKSKGVEVTIADNGEKALEVLEEDKNFDIVLMDIMMPVMDGYETMKAIRKKPEFRDLPILALTAKAMDTDREECIRCGANDYLSKPIDTKKLLSMLRVWMY